ncbi:MAG: LysM peptidoglycan-binding domain-containing protein, partial [Spirochaetaceae bacterium]|nr:LysM peptidoglycan-binding domain-containing protein [Spirochaetaceae bacterium]
PEPAAEATPAAAPEPPPPPPPPKAEEPPAAPTGAVYKIKWGDTLWDLSYAYYHNPWLYPRIAKANNIRNPDLIISGAKIRIPPR